MNEELKQIAEMIGALGESGSVAFKWWLIKDFGADVLRLGLFLAAFATIYHAVKRICISCDLNVKAEDRKW